MSRVLLDENLPVGLRRLLPGHEVKHATQLGWDGVENGELIAAAELAGFDVMVTADKSLRYQQNISDRQVAVVVLSTNQWATVRAQPEKIKAAVDHARAGTFQEVDLGRRT